jgi:4-hydroxybenzoate polyprenyltransferase
MNVDIRQLPNVAQGALAARSLLRAMRPYQWVKNLLVFGGLIFSKSLFDGVALVRSVQAFFLFCFASSAVYLLNDLKDVERDRLHPQKRLRPLASGELNTSVARAAMLLLASVAVAGGYQLGISFGTWLLLYLALNVAYTLVLKHQPILDVMCIASGFVIRAVAGVIVIAAVPSPWIILCTMTLAFFVGFGKRRHELTSLNDDATKHRDSLAGYSAQFLDLMMAVSAAAAMMSYALYTVADETVERFGSHLLMATTPFVMYGVFRYFYLVQLKAGGGDPAKLLVTDRPTLINGFLWAVTICVIIHTPQAWLPWWVE